MGFTQNKWGRTVRLLFIVCAAFALLVTCAGVLCFEPGNTRAAGVSSQFYFAEGYTGPNFDEYLCIGNPNPEPATVNATYYVGDYTGNRVDTRTYSVNAYNRLTVNVRNEVGYEKVVSIRLTSETPNLIAERPMYFNYKGAWTGGHDAVGAVAQATRWYFAEGTTREGFEEWITVLNSNPSMATLTFHYMIEGKGESDFTEYVDADSRATFLVSDHIGTGKDASLMLESDWDVVAERPMYFNYHGLASHNWNGGHCVLGTLAPTTTWCFAEGTTRSNFEEWLCIQNPNANPITVNATYNFAQGQGSAVNKSYTVPAKQRLTVSVNQDVGPNKDVSCFLSSESDFIAERPLYFNYKGVWDDGSNVFGAYSPGRKWAFAEGYTGQNFEEWLCLWNPYEETADVTITFYPESGTPLSASYSVPGATRYTVNVNALVPNRGISAIVNSSEQIVVERPMYFNYNGVWNGGHDVMGQLCPT